MREAKSWNRSNKGMLSLGGRRQQTIFCGETNTYKATGTAHLIPIPPSHILSLTTHLKTIPSTPIKKSKCPSKVLPTAAPAPQTPTLPTKSIPVAPTARYLHNPSLSKEKKLISNRETPMIPAASHLGRLTITATQVNHLLHTHLNFCRTAFVFK